MTVNGYEIGPRAILLEADLRGADLQGADLQGSVLRMADLKGSVLRRADLRGAALRGAVLRGADLQGADLREADLQEADLRGADLQGTNLREADLRRADLRRADLQGADLRGADLRRAVLQGTNLGHWSILPEGDLIGYKRIEGVLITLSIPANARRVHSPTSRKCRSERAIVLAVDNPEGRVVGGYDPSFVYEVGAEVTPDSFDDDIRLVCTHGIHFCITKEEALG